MASDARKPAAASPAKTTYLVLYNFLSAVAWLTVLGRTVAINAVRGPEFVYLGVGEWTRWTQTMAVLEVLHSALGIVRAPVATTVMQISSRILLVWFTVYPFPHLAQSPIYSSMLLAWSVTEVIRYSYFALSLAGTQPRMLVWLRYNTFFVLYPVGILSEAGLIYMAARGPAGAGVGEWYAWALYAVLAIYVPGSYILYTYMMKQRRKVMRSWNAQGAGKTQ